MSDLRLTPTRRYFGFGNSNDYVVLEGGRVLDHPPSVYNKGYSATREQAMADFKARWLNH
jgi:hypothetical protein